MKPQILRCALFYLPVLFLLQDYFIQSSCTVLELKPDNPFVYIGDVLELNCTLDDISEYNASMMYFSRGRDEPIDSKYIHVASSFTSQLIIPITTTDIGKNMYMCLLMVDNVANYEYIGTQFLDMEYKPRSPENLTCVINNWKTMSCDWKLGPYIDLKYIDVSMRWYSASFGGPCPELKNNTSCYWDPSKFNTFTKYTMTITVTHTKDNANISKEFPVEAIVKPGPITIESVTAVGSRCVLFTWSHDEVVLNGQSHRKLLFSIIYKSKWDAKSVNVSDMMNFDNYTLCNLHPSTQYNFKVSVYPKNGGYWSDDAEIGIKTLQEVPSSGPVTVNGSYSQQNCENGFRQVKIFFQHVPEFHHNGDLEKYGAIFSKQMPISVVNTEKRVLESRLQCDTDYSVELFAVNGAGNSKNNIWIFIPKMSAEDLVQTDVNLKLLVTILREADNKTYSVVAYWSGSSPASYYYLFWCKGTVVMCEDDIKWLKVKGDVTRKKITIILPDEVEEKKYIFAISSTYDSVFSPMVYVDCIYKSWAVPKTPPKQFYIDDEKPNRALRLGWDPNRCDQQYLIYILNYVINYCRVDSHDICVDEHETQTVDNSVSNYQLSNLQADTKYSLWIQAQSQEGTGPESERLYATPIDTELKAGGIVGIAIAGLTVLLFAGCGVVYLIRKCKCKSYLIKTPFDDAISVDDNDRINKCYVPHNDDQKPEVKFMPTPTTNRTIEHQISKDSGTFSLLSSPSVQETFNEIPEELENSWTSSEGAVGTDDSNDRVKDQIECKIKPDQQILLDSTLDYQRFTVGDSTTNSGDSNSLIVGMALNSSPHWRSTDSSDYEEANISSYAKVEIYAPHTEPSETKKQFILPASNQTVTKPITTQLQLKKSNQIPSDYLPLSQLNQASTQISCESDLQTSDKQVEITTSGSENLNTDESGRQILSLPCSPLTLDKPRFDEMSDDADVTDGSTIVSLPTAENTESHITNQIPQDGSTQQSSLSPELSPYVQQHSSIEQLSSTQQHSPYVQQSSSPHQASLSQQVSSNQRPSSTEQASSPQHLNSQQQASSSQQTSSSQQASSS